MMQLKCRFAACDAGAPQLDLPLPSFLPVFLLKTNVNIGLIASTLPDPTKISENRREYFSLLRCSSVSFP